MAKCLNVRRGRFPPMLRALYILAIFVSSALLFLIEPMAAKMILPKFGGSPEVWNTAMVFYQGMLLLGYAYANLSTRWLGVKRQALLHLLLLVAAAAKLPFHIPATYSPDPSRSAALQVLLLLAGKVGLLFFCLSAGAPLLQRWFSKTSDPRSSDPYFLYSASNLGSMLALLSYPLLVEPSLGLGRQAIWWSAGFGVMVLIMVGSAVWIWRAPSEKQVTEELNHGEPVPRERLLRWVLLAFAPSALLLGVTSFITSNLAPVPLLWVIPLALYLLSFILAFSRWHVPTIEIGRWLAVLIVPLAVVILMESNKPIVIICVIHLAAFFLAALMCHGEIAKSRPAAEHLTSYYFWISLGGVLGGIFCALLAPLLFPSYIEYPLTLALVCLLRPVVGVKPVRWLDFIYPVAVGLVTLVMWRVVRLEGMPYGPVRLGIVIALPAILCFLAIDTRLRNALSLAVLFCVGDVLGIGVPGQLMYRTRTFFGVHRVLRDTGFHKLVNGEILHGAEGIQPGERDAPTSYYTREGPFGEAYRSLQYLPATKKIAFVGMGAGTLAAYGRPGDRYTFYEIDPAVYAIASKPKYFTFLADCKALTEVVLGDARLNLSKAPDGAYGMIVLDAFSADNIPVHLLTREAIQLYLRKLSPNGVIAFHISSKYVDLKTVLSHLSADLHLCALFREDWDQTPAPDAPLKSASRWLYMARSWSDYGNLLNNKDWSKVRGKPENVWTDDYSNVAGALFSVF
jgi:spermidine synthase